MSKKLFLSYLDKETGWFDPMYNTIHIDEKWWFYIRKQQQCAYLAEKEYNDEDNVPVERGHKSFGIKVMFLLCAVALPQWWDNNQKRLVQWEAWFMAIC